MGYVLAGEMLRNQLLLVSRNDHFTRVDWFNSSFFILPSTSSFSQTSDRFSQVKSNRAKEEEKTQSSRASTELMLSLCSSA